MMDKKKVTLVLVVRHTYTREDDKKLSQRDINNLVWNMRLMVHHAKGDGVFTQETNAVLDSGIMSVSVEELTED